MVLRCVVYGRSNKSKTLDPEQVFVGVLDASQRRFHSHVFFRPTLVTEAPEEK